MTAQDELVPVPQVLFDGRRDPHPRLTVAVCVRDGARFLRAGFAADLERGWGDQVEFVGIDDGSDDVGSTSSALVDLAGRVAHGAVLRNDAPFGPGVAREQLVRAARGEYIWFVDCDDEYELEAARELAAAAERAGADMVVARAETERNGRIARRRLDAVGVGQIDGPELLALMLEGRVQGYLWNKLFRRSLFTRSSPPLPSTQEDFCRVVHGAARARRVLIADALIYRYMMRDGSASRVGETVLANLEISSEYMVTSTRWVMGSRPGLRLMLDRFVIWYHAIPSARVPVLVEARAEIVDDGISQAREVIRGVRPAALLTSRPGQLVDALAILWAPGAFVVRVRFMRALRRLGVRRRIRGAVGAVRIAFTRTTGGSADVHA